MTIRPIWMLPGESDLIRPTGPLVYRLFDADGELLYVGKTSNVAVYRIGRHMRNELWGGQIQGFTLEYHDRDHQALAAERAAIKAEGPRHNLRSVTSGA